MDLQPTWEKPTVAPLINNSPNLLTPNNGPKPEVKPPNRSWMWLIIGVVILAVIAGLIIQALKHKAPVTTKMVISNTLPKGYSFGITGVNQYPPGFPKQLVLESGVNPFRGEDTKTGSGEEQKIVEYYSTSTSDSVYTVYKTGITREGWQLKVDINSQGAKVLAFSKQSLGTFQVIVTNHDQGAQVKLVAINME